MTYKNILSSFICLGAFGSFAFADNLGDFATCLSSASGPAWDGSTSTCTLVYQSTPYMIGSTLTISSSSVRYITGGSGGTPTLERDLTNVTTTSPQFPIMKATSSANNIVIENLIFNGNRAGYNNSIQQPIRCMTDDRWIDLDLGSAG